MMREDNSHREQVMPKLLLLAIDLVRSTTKKRRGVCSHRVEELRRALEEGADVPPIRANLMEDGTFTVKDGRHRLAAHKLAGMAQIWAVVENIMRRFIRAMSALRFDPATAGSFS